ncbi:MAG: hypothetical protein JNL58_28650 [Planctomyces sp.]|nr:hypothetical protein [Planctomyces sp.]
MGPGIVQSVRRHFLPFTILIFLVSSSTGADKDFPNELNSDVDEPRISLPESTDKHSTKPVSARTIKTDDPLIKLVWETREAQRRRLLSTSEHTPWQIMHGMLALREDFIIRHNGEVVSGLDWISSGPVYKNEHWFEKTKFGGRAHPYSVPYAFEGHVNQFLAILSMGGLPLDQQFQTQTGPITIREMLKNAQMTTNDRDEATWTLWALSRYLPPDARWKNAKGEDWSMERLVKIEVDRSLQGAPCGGTHNLFALAHSRNLYVRTGKPLRGVWLESEYKIRKYIQQARMQQNSNGTLSSNFFRGREYKPDFDKRMASAGHILEFLMLAVTQEELSEPWIRRAIEATCNDLMANRKEYVSCSPLYHTVNALSIYLERVAPKETQQVAEQPEKTRTISQSNTPKSADSSKSAGSASGSTQPGTSPAETPMIIPNTDKTVAPDKPVGETSGSSAPVSQPPAPGQEPPAPGQEPPASVDPMPAQGASTPDNQLPSEYDYPPLKPVPIADAASAESEPVATQFVMLNSGPAMLIVPSLATPTSEPGPSTAGPLEPAAPSTTPATTPAPATVAEVRDEAEQVMKVISSSLSTIVRAATASRSVPADEGSMPTENTEPPASDALPADSSKNTPTQETSPKPARWKATPKVRRHATSPATPAKKI